MTEPAAPPTGSGPESELESAAFRQEMLRSESLRIALTATLLTVLVGFVLLRSLTGVGGDPLSLGSLAAVYVVSMAYEGAVWLIVRRARREGRDEGEHEGEEHRSCHQEDQGQQPEIPPGGGAER